MQAMQEQLVGKEAVVSAIKYSIFKGLINSLLIHILCRFGGTDRNL